MLLFGLQNSLNLTKLQADNNPISSIRILTWLNNPSVKLIN